MEDGLKENTNKMRNEEETCTRLSQDTRLSKTYRNPIFSPIEVTVAGLVVGQRTNLGPQLSKHSEIALVLDEVSNEVNLGLGP